MKILALNSGSSSIKYSLFDANKNYQLLIRGVAERIGQNKSTIRQIIENKPEYKVEMHLPDHHTAMHALHQTLTQEKESLNHIDAVGHRIVHGGEHLKNPTIINEEVIKDIKDVSKFAPLHCLPNVTGIEVLQELLPDIPHVAVFDTAAHATMPPKAYLYGIPMEYYEKYKIRKYGFHGINHSYVAREAAKVLNKEIETLKIISCHLGSGCSITAFENGRSIDNSMGLTPLEGLVMSSRSGDLDPALVLYLNDTLKLDTTEVTDLLNKKSGLLGLCGKGDMRDIIAAAKDGDKASQTAIDVFVYRIQKCIGAYIAALKGVDVIVFTGGIGENSPYIRALIADNFAYAGAFLDAKKNEKNEIIFSLNDSSIALMNIPANEEKVIAQQTHDLLA
jgi:acetate kinase